MESTIDVSNIKREDCAKGFFPLGQGAQRQGFQILVRRSVLNAIKAHGRSSMHAEVCGVLVGELLWDSLPFLYIEACIEGKCANYNVASVTFTSETWDYIHEELSSKYPDRKIVGWYHTHPGFGIFLSDMDMFINHNFFNFPWQTAYVYDPQAEKADFFIWEKSLMKTADAEVFEDEPKILSEQDCAANTVAEKIELSLESKGKTDQRKALKANRTLLAAALVVCLCSLLFNIYTARSIPATDIEIIQAYQEKLNQLQKSIYKDHELLLVEDELNQLRKINNYKIQIIMNIEHDLKYLKETAQPALHHSNDDISQKQSASSSIPTLQPTPPKGKDANTPGATDGKNKNSRPNGNKTGDENALPKKKQ